MTEFCLPALRSSTLDPAMMHYELIGVVNHSGTADFGHYFAYCKDGYNGGDNWFEYNDSSVSAVKMENVITKNAYVLMYRRSDLGKAVYSTLSAMNIQTVGGKKEKGSGNDVAEVILGVERQMNQKKKGTEEDDEDLQDEKGNGSGNRSGRVAKLERKRTEGVDNERKDGQDGNADNVRGNKKHMSIAERKAEKKKKKEEERKAKRK